MPTANEREVLEILSHYDYTLGPNFNYSSKRGSASLGDALEILTYHHTDPPPDSWDGILELSLLEDTPLGHLVYRHDNHLYPVGYM